MNASLALGRYLWTELRLRWRAQPASPLARLILTFALAGAAGVFLAGFAAAEAARRGELHRLGLDTMVLRAPATGALPANAAWPADHWAAPLRAQGNLLLLQQLPVPGTTPWGQAVPVLAAPLAEVGRLLSAEEARFAEAVWFSRTLSAGRRVAVTHRGARFTAVTAVPQGRWRALGLEEFVLVPAGATEGQGGAGRLDVVLFSPAGESAGEGLGRQLQALFMAERLEPPAIQDPGPVRRALAAFSRGQAQWRSVMVVSLGACVLLMFASLGMLEERQTRFTQALLRSFGVSTGTLWTAALVENLLLANLALALAVAAGNAGAGALLALAGTGGGLAAPLSPNAILGLACAVNAGVLLSLLPLWRALRLPVGAVLP
jgi:hypothetical protein